MALINRVTIRTTLGPDIVIEHPLGGAGSSSGTSQLVKLLKPAVDLEGDIGHQTVAPAGDPGTTAWPVLEAVLLVAGIAIGALVALKFAR